MLEIWITQIYFHPHYQNSLIRCYSLRYSSDFVVETILGAI